MFEISHHSASYFKSCPKKWYWYYIYGLEPRKKAHQLTLGSVVHEAFNQFYNSIPINKIVDNINAAYEIVKRLATEEEQETYIVDHKISLGMFLNYPNKNLRFEEIFSEEEFEVTVGRETHSVRFIGRVDGRVKQQGIWWVREVKTTGLKIQQFETKAQTSAQATGYVYGIRKSKGLNVEGVMYDVIKKPLLRRRVNEPIEHFAERIYLDYCDTSRHEFYFTRYYTYRSPYDLILFEQDIARLSMKMRECVRENKYYRNTDSCWVYNTECPYRRICFMEKVDPRMVEMYYSRKEKEKDGKQRELFEGPEWSKGSAGSDNEG